TFESLPKLLPGRRHIVVTRDPNWRADGAEVAHSKAEALALAGSGTVSIIGGAEIFRLFADEADAVELTELHFEPEGDTFLPAFDPALWHEVERTDHPAESGSP